MLNMLVCDFKYQSHDGASGVTSKEIGLVVSHYVSQKLVHSNT